MMDQVCLKVAIEKKENKSSMRGGVFHNFWVLLSSLPLLAQGGGSRSYLDNKCFKTGGCGESGECTLIWIVWEEGMCYSPLLLILGSVCDLERQERSSWVQIRDQPAQSPPFGSGCIKDLGTRRSKTSLWDTSLLVLCLLPAMTGLGTSWADGVCITCPWRDLFQAPQQFPLDLCLSPQHPSVKGTSPCGGLLRLRTTSLEEKKAKLTLLLVVLVCSF